MNLSNGFAKYTPDRPRPMIVAHRGASGQAPENTIASFSLALQQGAHAVEFDVQQSADRRVVVMHDEALERTTNGKGMIMEKDYRELRELDAGSWYSSEFNGERIPTLEDALDTITKGGYALVEIKHGSDIYPGIEKNIADIVKSKTQWKKKTVFIAFDPTILLQLRELDGEISTGLLTADPPEEYIDVAQEYRIQCFFPRWEKLKQDSISTLHNHGYSVHPWVVDQESDVRKVMSMRPDSISSNYPARLKEIFHNPA